MTAAAAVPHLDAVLPSVVRALLHKGVPEAFARYQEAGEFLEQAVARGERSEDEDVEVLDSPRVARAHRLVSRFGSDLHRARVEIDTLLGENMRGRNVTDGSHGGNSRLLGMTLRIAPPHVLARARALASEERARGVELTPRSTLDGDEEALGAPDPAPDPRLTKKDCSCGRRVRAYLFDEHAKTCAAIDRTPIVDRDEKPENEEEPVTHRAAIDIEKALALRADGKSLAEIGETFGVSHVTVARHLAPHVAHEEHGSTTAPDAPVVSPSPSTARRSERTKPEKSDSIEILRACVSLLEPLPEHERRAVAYYLGARYSTARPA